MRHPASLIAALAALPAPLLLLAACSSQPPAPDPLTKEALAAVRADPGAPTEQLAREIDDLFANEGLGETRAVVVMHAGELAAERYAAGYGPETRFVSWSMAKTVTATMIGLLVADGRLTLDETPPIPRWRRAGDPRGEITLRQLLQMRSGLRHTESGDPPYESSEVRMLFLDGRDDMATFAESQPLEAEPGREFEYSSNTTVILADIAARVLTRSTDPDVRRKAVADYLQTRLFGPLGMTSMVPEFDRAGTLVGGSLMHGTARDWARFGEFLRNKGSYRGTQVVPRRWVEFMTTPSPRSGHYGAQTWLNRDPPEGNDPLFADRGPKSLFAMIGHMGQYVLVAPDRKLTVVRLGHSDREERPPMLQELADVVALYPGT
ncbi:6-aminohexanoate-dimer hydrolase [Tsuneonella dongtanensis]|uniref:6-aminohexanoate-dimer hydrolase n=1 Tax=Tsuneonella dongtanensis TaxID=692370 RepID=A0A1B2A9T7_9SPHN|nr:serine hydrolase [Tsuneonella dongtanensis]ANY18919.1 6-aminohexanoate-dimer hydrolase [Tsuneonella dongtanensis]